MGTNTSEQTRLSGNLFRCQWRVVVGTKETRTILDGFSHAGIVRLNGGRVNIKIHEYMVSNFGPSACQNH
jgi:hypothetical protein